MSDDRFSFSDSVSISATPRVVYDVVSDVTRTGEWSPICVRCEWDDADGPHVGAHFTGHNRKPDREWSTTNEVVTAEPGHAFAWEVNGGLVRWGYRIAAEGRGTGQSDGGSEGGRAPLIDMSALGSPRARLEGDELDRLVAELLAHLDHADTLTYCPLWQVSARRT